MRSPARRPTAAARLEVARRARRRVPEVALHPAVVLADDGAVDVVARAAKAAGEAERVRVDELGLAASDRRAFGVGDPRIDRHRRGFGLAAEFDRRVDRQLPGVIEVEVRESPGQPIGVGQPGGGILGGVARDRQRLVDGGAHGVRREVGGARVAAPLPDVHGEADALVAVVGDGLDLALAHGDALADRLRHVGLGGGRAAGPRGGEDGLGDPREFVGGKRKAGVTRGGSGHGRGAGAERGKGARADSQRSSTDSPDGAGKPGRRRAAEWLGYDSKRCAPIPGRAPPFRQTMPLPDRPSRRRRGDSPVDPTGPVVTAVTEPSAASSRDDADDAPLPPSKTRRKADMHALQDLGEALVGLDARRFDVVAGGRAARAAGRRDPGGALDHRPRRPAPPAAVRRQADARGRPRADPRQARRLGRGPRRGCGEAARARTAARAPARRAGGARRPGRDASDARSAAAALADRPGEGRAGPGAPPHAFRELWRALRELPEYRAVTEPTSADRPLVVGLVSISDRAATGVYEDKGLPTLTEWLTGALTTPWRAETRLIPDEQPAIERTLVELVDIAGCDLVLTTGGTGPAPRDVTPEATLAVAHKVMPGFGEQMRQVSPALRADRHPVAAGGRDPRPRADPEPAGAAEGDPRNARGRTRRDRRRRRARHLRRSAVLPRPHRRAVRRNGRRRLQVVPAEERAAPRRVVVRTGA